MQQLLKGMHILHTYSPDHPVSLSMGLKRPSAILVYFFTPSDLPVASCSVLSGGTIPNMDMIFTGQAHQQSLITLFDSGAMTSFISRAKATALGLPLLPPNYKAVSMASGDSSQILGRVSFTIRWGPITTKIEAHVIEHLLPDIDLIAGSDFLTTHHAVMDFDLGQCTLRSPSGSRASLKVPTSGHFTTQVARSNSPPAPRPSLPGTSTGGTVAMTPPVNPPTGGTVAMTPPVNLVGPNGTVAMTPVGTTTPPLPSLTRAQAMRAVRHGATPYLVLVQSRLPSIDHVPVEVREKLTSLLTRFSSIFHDKLPPGLPPNFAPCEVIPTEPGAKPPYKPPFRMSPLERVEIERQVKDLLARGVIEPSSSPYGAACFFVSKPNGGIRHVYDYRALNAITTRNRFPLPNISDLLENFNGFSYVSSLDLTDGFSQIRLLDSDIEKTAFPCPQGHFHFLIMPQGLSNAPSVFSRAMSKIFAKHTQRTDGKGPRVLIYLDDLCIISSGEGGAAGHLADIEAVLQTIKDSGLIVKLSKCHWFQQQLKFLGHIISSDGVSADPAKVSAILNWEYPRNAKGLQQFLGLCNYFCKQTPNWARLAAPLFHLCKKNVPFSTDSLYTQALEKIKLVMSCGLLLCKVQSGGDSLFYR